MVDESIPLGLGVLGQETTARVASASRCARSRRWSRWPRRSRRAPRARGWSTSPTPRAWSPRPSSRCSATARRHLRLAVGPVPAGRRRLGRDPALWFDYFGLNHLGWLRGVRDGGGDLLPALLADDDALASFEEGALFGAEWLRTLGMIPNEYLYYFYYGAETVAGIRGGPARRLPARAAGALLLGQRRRAARGLARAAPERERTYMAEAAQRGGPGGGRRGRLRGRGDGGRRRDRERHPRDADLSTPPTAPRCRSWTPARWSRCPRWSAAPARSRSPSAPVPDHAQALCSRQGGRTGDDRGGAHRLDRARGEGARPPPARPSVTPRARSSPATGAAARAAGALRMIDLAVATTAVPGPHVHRARAAAGPGEEFYAGELHARRAAAPSPRSAPPGSGCAPRSPARSAPTTEGAACAPRSSARASGSSRRRGARTATTVVMPTNGERAMVTYDPGVRSAPRARGARAARGGLRARADRARARRRAGYVTCGDADARATPAARRRARPARARCSSTSREAIVLTGAGDARGGRRAAGRRCATARRHARAHGALRRRRPPIATPGVDVGRAGRHDRRRRPLRAAYVWADLRGAEPEDAAALGGPVRGPVGHVAHRRRRSGDARHD